MTAPHNGLGADKAAMIESAIPGDLSQNPAMGCGGPGPAGGAGGGSVTSGGVWGPGVAGGSGVAGAGAGEDPPPPPPPLDRRRVRPRVSFGAESKKSSKNFMPSRSQSWTLLKLAGKSPESQAVFSI